MASSPSSSASSAPKERGQFGVAEAAVPPETEGERRLLARRLEGSAAPAAAPSAPVVTVPRPTPVIRREAVQRPLIAIRAEGSLPPLFFTHTILGDVVFVRQFLPYLPPEQPLYAIQARGLEGEDAPHNDFEEMAADFVKLIRRVQPAGP